MEQILFEYKNQPITVQTIKGALKALGIKAGDDLMVHSGFEGIGKIRDLKDTKALGNLIIDVIKPGTLIFPTYTYSFCEKKLYDPKKSLATIGALPNIFWRRPDASR